MKEKIDDKCLKEGYHRCRLIKEQIDAVLRLNSNDRTELGVSSTKEEKEQSRLMEIQRLKSVRHLDEDFIDKLLNTDD